MFIPLYAKPGYGLVLPLGPVNLVFLFCKQTAPTRVAYRLFVVVLSWEVEDADSHLLGGKEN